MWATYKLSWAMFWPGDWWNAHKRKNSKKLWGKQLGNVLARAPVWSDMDIAALTHEELTHGARDRIMVLHSMWMGTDLWLALTLEDLTQGAKTYLLYWWPRWCTREEFMLALTHEEQTQVPGPKCMSSSIMHEEQTLLDLTHEKQTHGARA